MAFFIFEKIAKVLQIEPMIVSLRCMSVLNFATPHEIRNFMFFAKIDFSHFIILDKNAKVLQIERMVLFWDRYHYSNLQLRTRPGTLCYLQKSTFLILLPSKK